MFHITAKSLGRLLKNALFSPFITPIAYDPQVKRVEPTLAPDRDSAFAARCERRLDEALSATSRVR